MPCSCPRRWQEVWITRASPVRLPSSCPWCPRRRRAVSSHVMRELTWPFEPRMANEFAVDLNELFSYSGCMTKTTSGGLSNRSFFRCPTPRFPATPRLCIHSRYVLLHSFPAVVARLAGSCSPRRQGRYTSEVLSASLIHRPSLSIPPPCIEYQLARDCREVSRTTRPQTAGAARL